MGNYIKYFFPCLKCRNRFNTQKVDEGNLDNDDIKIKDVTKNEFYCPYCEGDEEISEILKIHSDNGKIEFKCLKLKKEFEFSFEEYCDKAKQRIEKKCDTCISNQVPEPKTANQLCLGCWKYYCTLHGKEHIDGKNRENDQEQKSILTKFIQCSKYVLSYIPCLTNMLRDKDEHKLIYIRQISSYCPLHKLETSEICLDCEKNVCEMCLKSYHKWHKKFKIDLSCKNITNIITNIVSCSSLYDEEILEARKIIYDKGQKLLKMKEFYEMVKSASDSDKSIKTYKDNLTMVSKCIEREKKRDSKVTDLVFYKLEQMKNKDNNPNNENNNNNSKKESVINNIKEYA